MLRRFAAASAGGALALMSYSVMAAAPASAGRRLPNTVEVTKVVKGENPGGGFQVVVTCKPNEDLHIADGASHEETLVFPPEGGTESAGAPGNSTCTVEETGTGGASKVVVSGSPCEFKNEDLKESTPAPPIDNEGQTCKVTVTNTFEPPAAGPAGPQGPPGEVQPAQAVVSTARFTG